MEPTVLVTGGSGFVGSAVVTALKGRHPEWKLSVLDLQEPIEPQLQVEYWYCDITNQTEVETLIAKIKPTGIIHTAGIVPHLRDRYSREARQSIFRVNVDGTRNVVTAARNNNVKALVWTGSCTAVTDDFSQQYPNIDESWPTSSHSLIYGESKASLQVPHTSYMPVDLDARPRLRQLYSRHPTSIWQPVLCGRRSSLGPVTVSSYRLSMLVSSTARLPLSLETG